MFCKYEIVAGYISFVFAYNIMLPINDINCFSFMNANPISAWYPKGNILYIIYIIFSLLKKEIQLWVSIGMPWIYNLASSELS